MTSLINELFVRPMSAISSGLAAFQEPGRRGQQFETALARMAHRLTAPPPPSTAASSASDAIPPDLAEDAKILSAVERYLSRGRDLRRWWREIESRGGPPDRFPLERSLNRPTRSYGFFDVAPVDGRMMPVMGNVQEMFYDQVRAPSALNPQSTGWLWAQLREFVMKYFMRISSFREPASYVDASYPTPPPALRALSWCPQPSEDRVGFGFSQLFGKRASTGEIEPFSSLQRYAIVDQREIGSVWEWLLLKVRIFDFAFRTRPFGEQGPELVFGLNEESHLVVHEDFVNFREHHLPGVLGEYGIGYAFVKSPVASVLRYGPGEFDAAIELINFRIYETGYVSVRMIFISNRPVEVARVVIDAVDLGLRAANLFSFGLASRLLTPARGLLNAIPFTSAPPLRVAFDPVSTFVSAANLATASNAANALCISREQFERVFLLQHFKQHYQTVTGSLLTWRQFPDWLDEAKLPAWVVTGLSS